MKRGCSTGMEPSTNPVPRHVGIIMDGNRRFARRLMMKPWKGHEWGAKKLERLLDVCHELGVHELTVYAFSLQNFDRPKDEFVYLMKVFEQTLSRTLKDPRLERYGVRINIIGRLDLFPNKLQELSRQLMDKTTHHDQHILNIALGYGGQEEVLEAVYKIARRVKERKLEPEDINAGLFENELYLKSKPDLIIRTGGEQRTSNFLVWQSAYSEFLFLEKLWPEFDREDFVACIEEYQKRHRRFGK